MMQDPSDKQHASNTGGAGPQQHTEDMMMLTQATSPQSAAVAVAVDEKRPGGAELRSQILDALTAADADATRCADLDGEADACAIIALLLDGRRLMAEPSETDKVAILNASGEVSEEAVPDNLASAQGFSKPDDSAGNGVDPDSDAGVAVDGACASLCGTIAEECGSAGDCDSECSNLQSAASLIGLGSEAEDFVRCCQQLAFPDACSEASGFQTCLDSACEPP